MTTAAYSNSQPNLPTRERLAMLALHHIPGIGGFLIKQLISYCGSAVEVFKTPKGALRKIPHIGEVLANAITTTVSFEAAEIELKKVVKSGSRMLFFNDSDFPQRLKAFDDSPSMLYVRGNVDLNTEKIVSIVGTRQATPYGKKMVEELVDGLIPHRPLIVSGLAYGIDIQAHKQALAKNIPTLGVMASGIDIIYPATHAKVAEKMLTNGGLITENPVGKSPEAYCFPIRNRIIAGLADALIVVETANKGGALITAEIANSYNKDVFAIPGSIGKSYSAGCNKLIKINKAHLLTTAKDIEYIMGWEAAKKKPTVPPINISSFSRDEQKIITLLQTQKSTMTIDELSRKSSIPPGALAALLLSLELNRIVQSDPGKNYRLEKQFS